MSPVGALMIEHRLIELMISLLEQERERLAGGEKPDLELIGAAAKFLHDYADACHHGKEEDIFFRELADKPLHSDLRSMVSELVAEHVYGRQVLRRLQNAREGCQAGEAMAAASLKLHLQNLVEHYHRHIEKEDKSFFVPAMDCFEEQEQAAMLGRFHEFDSQLLQDQYRHLVAAWEKREP